MNKVTRCSLEEAVELVKKSLTPEKKIEEVSKEVEDKYNFTDDEFEQYVLERKIKSYNTLSNELNSYKNLNN